MGLLETLLKRLETLEAKLDKMGAGCMSSTVAADEAIATDIAAAVETPVAPKSPSVVAATEKVESQTNLAEVAELDIEGLPWDERINSGKVTDFPHAKTTKGAWKKRKGVSPAKIAEVQAELRASVSGSADVATEPSTPATPAAPSTPAVPATPTVPSTPAVPSTPGVPSTPATPVTPVVTEESMKEKAIKLINELTSKYGITYDVIIAEILTPHGVDTFETLPEASHETVHVELKGWFDYLELIQELVDKLDALDPEGTHGLIDGVNVYCQQFGGSSIGTVPKASVSQLYDTIGDFHKQWDTYIKSL